MAKTLRKLGVERSFLSLTSTIQSVPDDILNGESFPPVPRMGAGEGSPLFTAAHHRPASSKPCSKGNKRYMSERKK